MSASNKAFLIATVLAIAACSNPAPQNVNSMDFKGARVTDAALENAEDTPEK